MAGKNFGGIYLLPSALGEEGLASIPQSTRDKVQSITFFIVENERSARRFLRSIGYAKNFDEGMMMETRNDEAFTATSALVQHLHEGKDVGVISEAGCPGIADPGAAVVAWAHQQSFKVVPLAGPSSIFLALMASGMNGQQFAFHGYLPVSPTERRKKLKLLEEESARKAQTQLFMETPYRNDALLADILEICKAETRLCIASDITLPTERIVTLAIKEWRTSIPDLRKKPTIFLLLAR